MNLWAGLSLVDVDLSNELVIVDESTAASGILIDGIAIRFILGPPLIVGLSEM